MVDLNVKITELPASADTAMAQEDLVPFVDDPSGTPETKKSTRQQLLNAIQIRVQAIATSGGTDTLDADGPDLTIFTGTLAHTLTLPSLSSFDSGYTRLFYFKNRSTQTVTIDGNGAETIEGGATTTILAGQNLILAGNGGQGGLGNDWQIVG